METSDHASELPPNQLTNAGNLGPADLRARTRTLLEILTVLPEEVESYTLRLGENRRKEIRANLAQGSAPITVQFLNATLTHAAQSGKPASTLSQKSQSSLLKNEKFKGCMTTDILIVGSTRPVASKFNPKSIKGVVFGTREVFLGCINGN